MASKLSNKAKRLARNFALTYAAVAFKGSMHPDSWPTVDREYKKAKTKLDDYITDLEQQVAALRERLDLRERIDRIPVELKGVPLENPL